MQFKYANFPSGASLPEPSSDGKVSFGVKAPTDIWRKPPSHDVLDAPLVYTSLPVSKFKRARVTATGDWKTLYDQAGLALILPAKNGSTQKRWIKAGIEFYNDKCNMSVVAADEWADWSLLPLSKTDEAQGKMTVEMERRKEGDGSWGTVLFVYLLDENGSRAPIREITWVFHDSNEDEDMWVGMYGAKPTKDERSELVVTLEGFEVETRP